MLPSSSQTSLGPDNLKDKLLAEYESEDDERSVRITGLAFLAFLSKLEDDGAVVEKFYSATSVEDVIVGFGTFSVCSLIIILTPL